MCPIFTFSLALCVCRTLLVAGYGNSHAVAFGANMYMSGNAGQGPAGSHKDVAHVNEVSRGAYAGIGTGVMQ